MRTSLGLGLALGLMLGMPLAGCHNFRECTSDSDCPVMPRGPQLHCTSDFICARGTPAAALCSEIYPEKPPANAIVIGALVSNVSGGDKLPLEAFKLAIDQINQRRTPPLALHVCEISATADDAYKSMEVLTRQRKAVAVVGPPSSSDVFAIKDEVIRSGVPIMSHSATSPEISSLGTDTGIVNGLFYRVAPSDNMQGPVLARQLVPTPNRLAVLFVNDAYGIGLKDAFLAATTKQPDLTVSYEEPSAMPDLPGTQAAVNTIVNANPKPDYVIAITSQYSDIVVRDFINLPLMNPAAKIILTDGAKNQNILNLIDMAPQPLLNQHLQRIYGTAPTVDNTNLTGTGAYQTFVNDFKVRWQEDPSTSIYTAYAYDAIFAVALAIGASGANVTAANVSAMLGRIKSLDPSTQKCLPKADNQLVVGGSRYLESANKLRDEDNLVIQGASGTICFSPHGDRVSGLYERWAIDTANKVFTSSPTQ